MKEVGFFLFLILGFLLVTVDRPPHVEIGDVIEVCPKRFTVETPTCDEGMVNHITEKHIVVGNEIYRLERVKLRVLYRNRK